MVALVLAFIAANDALGDSITLPGSNIPIRGVTLERISSGRLFYTDARGARQRRALNDVAALGFDDLPTLAQAEQALRDGDHDLALSKLLIAMQQADEDVERIWMHRRLAQVHDQRGEYVQSVGHAASAVQLDPTLTWRPLLSPHSQPDQPPWPAAAETLYRLHQARPAVRDRTLQRLLDELITGIQPIERAARQLYHGPPIEPDQTISGYRVADIQSGVIPGLSAANAVRDGDDATTDTQRPPAGSQRSSDAAAANTAPPVTASTNPPGDAGASGKPTTQAQRIETLLAAGDFAAALAACQQAAADVGDQSIPQLLVQYGRALVGVARPQDASVMFTRAAVLYPDSEYAIIGLIETGLIYQNTYQKSATARRLFNVAAKRANQMNRTDLADRATTLADELHPLP